jgi:hypothetical protein
MSPDRIVEQDMSIPALPSQWSAGMLIKAGASWEVRVQQVMLGSAVVALIIGWAVGRRHERMGRSRRDFVTARTTMEKAGKIAAAEFRRAIGAFLVVAMLLLALFIAAVNLGR